MAWTRLAKVILELREIRCDMTLENDYEINHVEAMLLIKQAETLLGEARSKVIKGECKHVSS